MLILLLRFSCPYAFDGVNNSIFILAEAFSELGHRAVVLGGTRFQDIDTSNLRSVFDVDVVPEVRVIEKRRVSCLKLWLKWFKDGARIIKDYNYKRLQPGYDHS